jgi:hypothetical protein
VLSGKIGVSGLLWQNGEIRLDPPGCGERDVFTDDEGYVHGTRTLGTQWGFVGKRRGGHMSFLNRV